MSTAAGNEDPDGSVEKFPFHECHDQLDECQASMSCLEVKVQRNQYAQLSWLEIPVGGIFTAQGHAVLVVNT